MRGERRAPTTVANWIGRIGGPAYFALLVALTYKPDWRITLATPELSLRGLRSLDGVFPWAAFLGGTILLTAGRFVPLGFLAALACPRRRRWRRRLLFVGIPSGVLASALAAAVMYTEAGARTEVSEVLFAAALCSVGAWMGMAWVRGWRARLLLLPKLAGVVLLAVLTIGAVLYFSLRPKPFQSDSNTSRSDATRRVYRMFRGKNPKSLEPGATQTLRLTGRDLNDVLTWSTATLLGDTGRVQLELDEESAYLLISVISPIARGDANYLNAVVGGTISLAGGRLELDVRRLRLGPIDAPRFLLVGISKQITATLNSSPDLRPWFDAVTSLTVNAHEVAVTHAHIALPAGPIASLFQGDALEEVRSAVSAHTKHLLDSAAKRSPPDRRVGASMETAFRYARERSRTGDPIIENQAAILALGIMLGDSRVDQLVGHVMDVTERRAARMFQGATLRQRDDWPKHFFVSASISVLSMGGISDEVGIFKEELDSDGGSGFSFGDLLADRAGTAFAVLATRDEVSARAMQDRLARGYHVDDFMPIGADLPEDMPQAEFRTRYGGVGAAAYNQLVDEIDRRIASCAAYRKS